jgi:putative ABC transport system permease protein
MRARRTIGPSIRALVAHKLRASLALAAVGVGVAAVVLTSAIGAGVEQEVTRRMASMGTNLLIVRPAQIKRLTARKAIDGFTRTLEVDDAAAIARLARVARSAPGAERGVTVKVGAAAVKTTVRGTTPGYPGVRRFNVESGRFFDADDDRDARRVAVLGARVNSMLFDGRNPIGEEVRILGVPFAVVGTLQAKGALADGSDEDNQVLVPMRTAMRRILNSTWISAVYVSVVDPGEMEAAQTEIRTLLRARHRLDATGPSPRGNTAADDFAIQNTSRTMAMQQQTADALGRLSTGLAALALLVGGTGVLALMLLSVKERTGEIGLRMAVGATPRDILVQFLCEATLLALGGWLGGLALGAAGAAAVAVGTAWNVALPTDALLASLAMSLTMGLVFGVVPARQASRVPPIDALHAE